jgi:hypothetical protein
MSALSAQLSRALNITVTQAFAIDVRLYGQGTADWCVYLAPLDPSFFAQWNALSEGLLADARATWGWQRVGSRIVPVYVIAAGFADKAFAVLARWPRVYTVEHDQEMFCKMATEVITQRPIIRGGPLGADLDAVAMVPTALIDPETQRQLRFHPMTVFAGALKRPLECLAHGTLPKGEGDGRLVVPLFEDGFLAKRDGKATSTLMGGRMER